MSNALAMDLLRQSLGSSSGHVGASGYGSGGCCGSALMGGGARKEKPIYVRPVVRPASARTQANLQLARQGQNIGKMSASQYISLHNDRAREKAAVTRMETKNLLNAEYNRRLNTPNPMTKLQYCMEKCTLSAQRRKANAKLASARRRGVRFPEAVVIPSLPNLLGPEQQAEIAQRVLAGPNYYAEQKVQ